MYKVASLVKDEPGIKVSSDHNFASAVAIMLREFYMWHDVVLLDRDNQSIRIEYVGLDYREIHYVAERAREIHQRNR